MSDPRPASPTCAPASDPSFEPSCCAPGEPGEERVDDEYTAARLLFRLRFGDDWGCAGCGHPRWTQLRVRPRIFECNRCGHPLSVTADTALHRCRVPLTKVLVAARLLSRPGVSISARSLAKVLDVGLETAWSLGHRLRTGFLAAPAARLTDETVWWFPFVPGRLPRGERSRSPLGERVGFVVLADRSRHLAVETGRPDEAGLRRFLDRHTDGRLPAPGPVRLVYDPTHIGTFTHFGVSDRWLPLYVAAIAGWQNAAVDGWRPDEVTLRTALRCRTRPFAKVRPHRPRFPPRPHHLVEAERLRVDTWDHPAPCTTAAEAADPPRVGGPLG